ncbi:MAG: hypothetical protein J1E65_04325 [Lachnospiraceae bacterium]|nr:hypothetical protein [Lachnospiraceae bacterium]
MKITSKKALLIGLASSTLFGLAGCTTDNNMHGDVYGPPPYLEDNIPEAVYGPPIDEETMDDEIEDAEDTESVEDAAEDEQSIEGEDN